MDLPYLIAHADDYKQGQTMEDAVLLDDSDDEHGAQIVHKKCI